MFCQFVSQLISHPVSTITTSPNITACTFNQGLDLNKSVCLNLDSPSQSLSYFCLHKTNPLNCLRHSQLTRLGNTTEFVSHLYENISSIQWEFAIMQIVLVMFRSVYLIKQFGSLEVLVKSGHNIAHRT